MSFKIVQRGDISVVKLTGEVDASNAMDLRKSLQRLIDSSHTKILVDLKDVNYIDSTGLGILVMAYKLARGRNGSIKFSNVSPHISKLFELTNVNKLFEIYQSVEVAEKSFK